MTDKKALSQERYNQFAQDYVTSQTHSKGGELERLVKIAKPQGNWQALDIATGGGHTALKFAAYVDHVTATDLTPNMLNAARQFITGQDVMNIDFQLADAENLPFLDAQFNLVTCRIAPHHFPDAAKFVRESARVLKTGGILVVQDHVLPNDTDIAQYVDHFERLRDPSHNHAFTEAQWRTMFEQANLSVYHTEQLVKRHQLLDWAERQGNDVATILELQRLLKDASPGVAEWMMPENSATQEASFVNHHIIIAGRKS